MGDWCEQFPLDAFSDWCPIIRAAPEFQESRKTSLVFKLWTCRHQRDFSNRVCARYCWHSKNAPFVRDLNWQRRLQADLQVQPLMNSVRLTVADECYFWVRQNWIFVNSGEYDHANADPSRFGTPSSLLPNELGIHAYCLFSSLQDSVKHLAFSKRGLSEILWIQSLLIRYW